MLQLKRKSTFKAGLLMMNLSVNYVKDVASNVSHLSTCVQWKSCEIT